MQKCYKKLRSLLDKWPCGDVYKRQQFTRLQKKAYPVVESNTKEALADADYLLPQGDFDYAVSYTHLTYSSVPRSVFTTRNASLNTLALIKAALDNSPDCS